MLRASTKRVGNLIRSIKWSIFHIDEYLMSEADKEVKNLSKLGKRVLCIWDGSVIEKPESSKLEGLCPVISSKAKRLNRSRRGLVFNMPAARPIMVIGMQWTSALIAGMEGIPKLAVMSWWTTKGDYATKLREQEETLLRKCVRKWGDILIHVFDRGYSSGPWLQLLQASKVKFVIRWKKGLIFIEKKLWQIGLGKKYLAHKLIHDVHTGEKMQCDIWWTEVRHASYAYPLYLVKVRVKKNVYYLITNEQVKTESQAWDIVFTYKGRFVITYHEAGWQECKPVEELLRLAEKQPHRYILNAQGQWQCPPGEAYAARLGLTYRVRASDQINWVAQENWLVLEDYYHDLERLIIPEDVLLTLSQAVDETPGMTLADLHGETMSIPTDWINIAVAKRQLYVDLLAHRLTDRERTPIYPDETTARALTYRTRNLAQCDAHPVLMQQGESVMWDGQPWTIGNIGETEVTLISKIGVPFALTRTAFLALVKEGKIVGKPTGFPSNFTEEGRTRLAQASEQDLATAVFRHRVIHPESYDDEEQRHLAPQITAVPLRTKYHWQHLDREAEVTYGSGFIGLLPRYQECGGTRKLDPAIIALMEAVLRSHYDTVARKLKRGAYGEYLLQSNTTVVNVVQW
jgi:hypothetical protein